MRVAYVIGVTIAIPVLGGLQQRLELSRAKHPSLTGHARMARRVASLIPFYEFDEHRFFRSDDPPEAVATQRREGFQRLAALYREKFPQSSALTAQVRAGA